MHRADGAGTPQAAWDRDGQRDRQKMWLAGAAAAAALAAAYLLFYPVFVMKVLCFALFAASFNLLVGYVGIMSFGHAALFGCGAYVTAHAVKAWGMSPEVGLLLGVAAGAALGAGMGYLAIRRQGIYFAMITLALSQMVYFACLRAPFTGGEDGIQGVPRGMLFGVLPLTGNLAMYTLTCLVFLAGMLAVWRVIHSPFGSILAAIRDNEQRAESMGYRVDRYKLAAFTMSSALAALAGGMKALVFQIVTLSDVHWHLSGEVILMNLVGGIGTLMGPLVGSVVVVGLGEFLATSPYPVPVILGIIFVVCVMLFRAGIVGEVQGWMERRKRA